MQDSGANYCSFRTQGRSGPGPPTVKLLVFVPCLAEMIRFILKADEKFFCVDISQGSPPQIQARECVFFCNRHGQILSQSPVSTQPIQPNHPTSHKI